MATDLDGYFGKAMADTYDQRHTTAPDVLDRITTRLAGLAGDGPALEFAIGTGRVALPLLARGIPVSGIEVSAEMVEKLRQKDGADQIAVAIGDMTTARLADHFALVFLICNTIDNLTTQDAQVACFRNAAAHLRPGGRFVIETLVPPLQKLGHGQTTLAFDQSPDHWGIDEFDVVTQSYSSHHLWIDNGDAQQVSVPFRYVWPAELDLMARLAGLSLELRWGDWDMSPFTAISPKHVSVWRKPVA